MVIFSIEKCQQKQLPEILRSGPEMKTHLTSKSISKITIHLHLKLLRIDIYWTEHQLIQKLVS